MAGRPSRPPPIICRRICQPPRSSRPRRGRFPPPPAAAGTGHRSKPRPGPRRAPRSANLTATALGRTSAMFAAGVDIHGVHNWDRQGRAAPNLSAALAGDGISEADLREAARVTYESSPVSAVKTWRSPVLLIHADDDRNV